MRLRDLGDEGASRVERRRRTGGEEEAAASIAVRGSVFVCESIWCVRACVRGAVVCVFSEGVVFVFV